MKPRQVIIEHRWTLYVAGEALTARAIYLRSTALEMVYIHGRTGGL
jgi:hypothetical protein